jgi:glycosyltransferase involved in cell wall biosynthesis
MTTLGFSFIIPAYNEAENIAECIKSIQREIARHPTINNEIIVVDNDSTDDTAAIARQFDVKIVFEPRKGVVWARQTGSKAAKYTHLANIDADNRLPSCWMDRAIVLAKQDYVAFSGPLVYDGAPKWLNIGADIFYVFARMAHHVIGPTLQGGNYVIKKEIFEQMGGYDTSIDFYGEDTRTAQLASKYGKIKLEPELWILSSPRRMLGQGVFKTVMVYIKNYLLVSFSRHRSVTREYVDYR